jgi:hypothetical protein
MSEFVYTLYTPVWSLQGVFILSLDCLLTEILI